MYRYHPAPSNKNEMAHNWREAISQSDLLSGCESVNAAMATDLSRGDSVATLRVLYELMVMYNKRRRE